MFSEYKIMQIKKIGLLLGLLAVSVFGVGAQIEQASARGIKIYALRLRPGQDLRLELEKFTKENKLSAGFIMTAVGSLRETKIRLADQPEAAVFAGKFEIVALVGTLSEAGVHLHIAVSDSAGKTVGGHLVEGCKIYTTAEIIIGATGELVFTRETDKETTFKELKIGKRKRSKK
jgi:predicted DNA-binding protein with PD1-like motif